MFLFSAPKDTKSGWSSRQKNTPEASKHRRPVCLSLKSRPVLAFTHTGSLSVIPASRDEPVFDDSPAAERIRRKGSAKSPYLTRPINNWFIEKVGDRVFLDLLSSDQPTFLSGLDSGPRRQSVNAPVLI